MNLICIFDLCLIYMLFLHAFYDSHKSQITIYFNMFFFHLERITEKSYCPPLVADFGFVCDGAVAEGYRDTFEAWDCSPCAAPCAVPCSVPYGVSCTEGFSMNSMFAEGGLQADYELSNITSISMTPNGKYCIVGQSQGSPQIWDAVVRNKKKNLFLVIIKKSSFIL